MSVLSRESVEHRGLFRWDAVRETIGQHAAGRADNTDRVLSLLNLELWCRIFLDGHSPDDVAEQIKVAASR